MQTVAVAYPIDSHGFQDGIHAPLLALRHELPASITDRNLLLPS